MQAHAIRLDDAWVVLTWILLLSPNDAAMRTLYTWPLNFECGLTKQEKKGNMILYLSAFLHLSCPP